MTMSSMLRSATLLTLIPALVAVAPRGVAAQVGDVSASDTLDAPPAAIDPNSVRLGWDTVMARPGETYPAGSLKRLLLGDLNRELWTLRFPVPVLDLDSVGGGLTLDELSGGKQTLGLRFLGRDGVTYQFRSIVKRASRALPSSLEETPVGGILQDQMAAQFPLSAMVVAELLEAAGILVAKPRPVVMPDHPRLGEYREAFAGRMGWIEIRPNEREAEDGEEFPGFAGSPKITGTDALYEELIDDPESFVDAPQFLRARLIDMVVGDWDRHQDQWRWASYDEENLTRWLPIPRDRDWAFSRIDGVLPWIAGVVRPSYTGFAAEPPDVLRMHWSAQEIDRKLLAGVARETYEEVARELVKSLSDSVIDNAVGTLPDSYLTEVGAELRNALKVRRDALPRVAEEFYELLAGWVDLQGTEERDSVHIRADGPSVHVEMRAPHEGDFVRFARTFLVDETRDIRLHLRSGDDFVVVEGEPAIKVRIVSAAGRDTVVGGGRTDNVVVYGHPETDEIVPGPGDLVESGSRLAQDGIESAYFRWDSRDWGSVWLIRPDALFNSDLGAFAGARATRLGFGFGSSPYHSRFSVSLMNGFDQDRWRASAEWEQAFGGRGWHTSLALGTSTDEPVWLYGFGNEVSPPMSDDTFRAYRSRFHAHAFARYQVSDSWKISAGPRLMVSGRVKPGGVVFDTASVYGAGEFDQVGLVGRLDVDTRGDPEFPTSGRKIEFEASLVPALLDVETRFGGVAGAWTEYLSMQVPLEPALQVRLRGERTWGPTPFFELPFLGGAGSLPGFTPRRFVGTTSASLTGLLRLELLEPEVFTELEVGVHGLATTGRVWYEDEDSRRLHSGFGGGAWINIPAIGRTVSFTLVRGDVGSRVYLDFGMLF